MLKQNIDAEKINRKYISICNYILIYDDYDDDDNGKSSNFSRFKRFEQVRISL